MDAPVETHLESTDNAGHAPNKLPELSRSQTNLLVDGPPAASPNDLKRGKSLRTRPDVVRQQSHGLPPTPLKDSAQRPELRSRVSSKMPLFSLFSKPKVEKLRGYAEPGLESPPGPPRANSNSAATLQKPDIAARVQNADAEQGRVRPTTSRSYTGRGARHMPLKEPLPPLPTDRKLRSFDPPPLFQVWPQSRKSGVLEVSSVTTEPSSHKAKSRTSGGLFEQGSNLSSLNIPGNRGSGTTVKSAIRHAASGSISNQRLPERIFVLTTSGFLLQYASEGPTDRLPERMLQLGKDSAAYASDLIPGRHHVLQIAQTVDTHGTVVSTPHSILSRFGIRNQAAKRLSSNFLIVMPGAQEMDEWMTAIKREIEVLGGKRVRSDSETSKTNRPKTGEPPKIDLKKTPSQSHRYQVKRDPTKPSIVTSPSSEVLEAFPPVQTGQDDAAAVHSDHTTDVTNEVYTTAAEDQEVKTRPRAPSDTPSNSSSTSMSVEQQQLDKLRNSVRASHSTVATSVAAASRTNSITSTPPSDLPKESSEGARDVAASKVPYRSLSSYTLAKRRSAAPLSLKDTHLPESTKADDALQQKLAALEGTIESPIMGYGSPMTHPNSSPTHNRLTALQAHSVPNLKVTADNDTRRDSPLAATLEERPESFIADLPDPTTWANKTSPSHKTATIPMPPLLDTAAARAIHKSDPSSPSYQSPHSRPLRSNSNSFSLPLRAPAVDATPPKANKRASDEPEVFSPIPAVTTLTAKVDIASRTNIDSSHIPARKSSISRSPPRLPAKSPKRSPSARLSLFPTASTAPPPPAIFVQQQTMGLKRSPSSAVVDVTSQAQANGTRLARPTSLQVRSNPAPFLASVRNSGAPTGQPRVTTVPIRSLKPSRSIATMQTVRTTPAFNPNTPKLVEESADLPMTLLGQLPETLPANPPPRTRRAPRSRTSLPSIDFGVSLAGLGPPAPPPQAPLPEIPTAVSRPQSPENVIRRQHPMIPIGMAISETIAEEKEKPTAAPASMGLGIQVGGTD
ncbi:hypothetical protein M409DRAFT_59580 [Zasmidium cellare ATCC 36951]|uniref:PH domain-containing protein n=1 Tax=Zasmidium cellare ATCC 36951 TaxID=1080233 RepID=A0A6A6C1G0_ZASCE|nr:uncharacterized protein M409DRAFT_59580 [Zasmidium cellare ATCC 36951]KAF2160785.1 hypothetical protein M409DRAFT_59580 [Zasmidium cellare ATCC 36951]